MVGYPGSKGGAGAWQQIVSLMPPHRVYVEPYLGGGAVLYAKRPAAFSIVSDADPDILRYHARQPLPRAAYLVADALALLPELALTRDDLVYLDPPYHPAVRAKAKLYNVEADEDHHSSLLAMLQALDCNVILSGYRCAAYNDALSGWHRTDYGVMTRGGRRIESAWCNFEPGLALHDTRFVGDGFRERERIKRKRDRWAAKFRRMPPAERAVIAEALDLASSVPASGAGT